MKIAAAVVFVCAAAATARAETVHGVVVDRATRAPVAGAIITAGSEYAASDDDGTFALELAPGRYTLAVTADFLEPASRTIVVRVRQALELVVEVEPAAQTKGETIEITDVAPTAPGESHVDAKLARTLPGGGDAAKIVQSLPAVARPSAGSTEIVVWGAAPSETRVFVDGVPVPALYHLGGYRSALGNDLIGDIRLAPAAFGVDRGRAIGGVIDIGLGDPATAPEWRAQADALDGSLEGRAQLGPVVIAAALRKSWLDHVVGLIEDPQQLAPNAPLPKWSDAQLVARAPIADRVVLTAWAIGSLDSLERTLQSDDPATRTDEQTQQSFVRAQVTLRRDRADGHDAVTLWGGRDRASDDFRFGLVPADRATTAWVGGARAVQETRISDAATLTIGADLDGEQAALSRDGSLTIPAREGDLHIFGQPPGQDVNADAWHATTLDAAGHAALDLRAGRFIATLGGRTDGWLLGASRLLPRIGATPALGTQEILVSFDPRGSVQARITDEAVVRVDAGRYHQARDAADTSSVFGTPTLGLEQAWHAVAGAQWRRGVAALEVAAYLRNLEDLVVRDLAVTPPLAKVLTQNGTGYVRGVQVTARVLGWRGVSGWLSYNLSRSRRTDDPTGDTRFFDHDQTHGLIAVAGWAHGPWTVGARVRYATGEPRTPVIGALFDSQSGRYQPIAGEHNGTRLPAFFAADLRGERRLDLGGGVHGAVYLEVQNLTDRANAEELIYNADFTQQGYLTSLPLLAIAGLRIER